jgi:hypothetical protein
MSVVDCSFDHPLKLEEEASAPLAGGIMQHGFQCGMLWGASLGAGAEAYRRFGSGPQAETMAIMAAQRIVESFQARTQAINCADVTEVDWQDNTGLLKFFVKGGPIGCFRLAAGYAPEAFRAIETALAEDPGEVPTSPVSCAALLAQKMGVSDMHTVMAAGFAGGIGLCGGACGALAAAIWIITMNSSRDGASKLDFQSPEAMAAIDRFVECTDCEFDCSAIVGRKFENISDHAGHLYAGGCSEIIKALAARPTA